MKKKIERKVNFRNRAANRQRNLTKYKLPKNVEINYKNLLLLQKYVNDRGKIVPRRISGIAAKAQRQLAASIKYARFLALLKVGGVNA